MSHHHDQKINPARWRYLRRRVLLRDKYRCRACKRAGRLEVDHVRSLKRGGDPYALGNLQALCRTCHCAKTARENTRPGRLPWLRFRDELRGKTI